MLQGCESANCVLMWGHFLVNFVVETYKGWGLYELSLQVDA